MSERITIEFNDGEKREWRHQGRAGGSYTIRLSFEGEFAIVTDEWGKREIFPGASIRAIAETPAR